MLSAKSLLVVIALAFGLNVFSPLKSGGLTTAVWQDGDDGLSGDPGTDGGNGQNAPVLSNHLFGNQQNNFLTTIAE